MLSVVENKPLPEFDSRVFDMVVPANHYLRRVSEVIDFERFRHWLQDAYSPDMGRPSIDPIRMLKVLFLCFHYKLSDRQVIERTRTDMAFRWFLRFELHADLPNHTNGTHFRQRLGEERFKQIFQEIVTVAREHGLVRDRLRLKDATHFIADVAELRPLALAAQVRDHLLRAAMPFFPEWVQTQRVYAENITQTTAELPDAERLSARVVHLQAMVMYLREQVAPWPVVDTEETPRRRLRRVLAIADKLLADRADPEAGDRLASAVDPDARTGLHGRYFNGFLLDMAMDADSEIITAVNVLPANSPEAEDAIKLIRQEEEAQGNDVQGLSMDGAGFNGPVLRELSAPEGLNIDVTVPPPKPMPRSTYGPERFSLTVLDNGCGELTCPAGQTTRQRERLKDKHACRYTFKASQCARCSLRDQCLQKPQSKKGRTVIKNDYEVEHQRVYAKAKTAEYAQTRREHPKVERKLGELSRHHGNRRSRYRGLPKALVQTLVTALVVNVKRIVTLLTEKTKAVVVALPVRAEAGMS
jgi:transposase